MTLDEIKRLAETLSLRDNAFVNKAAEALRYFKSENDIKKTGIIRDSNGLRSADNRVPSNFLYTLIIGLASYVATNPVNIDVGNDQANAIIQDELGAKWQRTIYELVVDTSLAGNAYIHYWVDENNEFQYAPIEGQKVMAIESSELLKGLEGVIYQHRILQDGEFKTELDYFTDKSVYFYITDDSSAGFQFLEEFYPWLNYKGNREDQPNELIHGMDKVPFIKFKNNLYEINDLTPIKGLIDAYDKVLSGYINDLEDIQQILLVLEGYEGEDLNELKENLKKFKIIKLDNKDEFGGDIRFESIQIPYEARNSLLDLLRKRIYEDYLGFDRDPEKIGVASSGVALMHQYDGIEMKAAQIEMYFRPAIEELVRVICEYHGIKVDSIKQTWTRNIPVDEASAVQMVRQLDGLVTPQTQLSLLPFIDDPAAEYEALQEYLNEKYEQRNEYFFGGSNNQETNVDSETDNESRE